MHLTPDGRFMIKKTSPDVGEGLFAVLPIAKGEFVLEYTGEKLSTQAADESASRYLFVLNDHWTVNGPVPENTAGYINHACDPNTEASIEDGHIMIHAIKDIMSGEQITMDYGPEYFDEYIKPVGCKCATCVRGAVRSSLRRGKHYSPQTLAP